MARKQDQKVTWSQTVRDVLIRAIDKGQGPFFLIGLIFIVVLIKLPPQKVGELVDSLFNKANANWWLGYILFIVALLAWGGHAKQMRRISYAEQERMGKEKSTLQESGIGEGVKSSRKKRR